MIVSRLLLVVVTAIVALVRHQSPLAIWDQWDTRWYLGVAIHGYHWSLDGKSALAFFPLYPLLVRVGITLGIPGLIAGLVLSNIAFAGALFYLYRLVHQQWGGRTAHRAAWLLALFPTAFFTFAPYAEAPFLLCTAAALYHARNQRAFPAGLWAVGAILSRPTGIILLPAVLIAIRPYRLRSSLLIIAPAAVGVGAFAVYLAQNSLSILMVSGAQRPWHRAWTEPLTGFASSIRWLTTHGSAHLPWAAENLLQLAVTVICLAVTVLAWRSLTRMSMIYCTAFWLLVLSTPEWLNGYYAPFSSMDRLVLALFPLAGWAAGTLPNHRFHQVLAVFAALMAGATTVHLVGGWVG